MKMKFIGDYTLGRSSIKMGEYVFDGRRSVEVDISTDMGRRLFFNQDFEVVGKGDDALPAHDQRHLIDRAKVSVEGAKAELSRREWEGPDLDARRASLATAEKRLAALS